MRDFVLTSESVTAGHPDKLCDQISDAVIDAYLTAGVRTPVTAECAIATGVVFLSIRSREDAPFDPAALARRVIEDASYPPGLDQDGPTIMLDLARTASNPELPAGVATHMTKAFGHACRHTPADAGRKASGPIRQPGRRWPLSTGAPIRMHVFAVIVALLSGGVRTSVTTAQLGAV